MVTMIVPALTGNDSAPFRSFHDFVRLFSRSPFPHLLWAGFAAHGHPPLTTPFLLVWRFIVEMHIDR
jgi:hypothetical protein